MKKFVVFETAYPFPITVEVGTVTVKVLELGLMPDPMDATAFAWPQYRRDISTVPHTLLCVHTSDRLWDVYTTGGRGSRLSVGCRMVKEEDVSVFVVSATRVMTSWNVVTVEPKNEPMVVTVGIVQV